LFFPAKTEKSKDSQNNNFQIMYWIFLVLFIIAVLIPDLIRNPVFFLAEERAEEIVIFLMGMIGFLVFMRNEYKLSLQKREKEKDRKRMNQAVKDLVESYSYIGEVNRKMDILMNIALGLSDRSALDKSREKEIYRSIVSAASFLIKGDYAFLRFMNIKNKETAKEVKLEEKNIPISNEELIGMGENINVKKFQNCLVVSSPRVISGIKSYLIVCDYDEEEKNNPKNMEILKVFASQALFLFSYLTLESKNGSGLNSKITI
jgi:hypothetical protein